MAVTLSDKALASLRWFSEQTEPVRYFGGGATPSLLMVARLRGAKLIDEVSPRVGKLVDYRINEAGRAAIANRME